MPISISIASGKGGVGKTSIAVNLALTIASLGSKVVFLDADFGLANAHLLMGYNPSSTVRDTIFSKNTEENSLERAITKGPIGLKLISGGNGLLDLLNLDQSTRFNLIRSFDPLASECDVFFIDVPAGASDSSLSFVNASDKIVIVLVGEPTSFMDAYTMVKAAHVEGSVKEFAVVVNMADNEAQSKETFDKFNNTVSRFLDVNLSYLGYLPHSRNLRNSIVKRKPLVLTDNKCRESLLFKSMSKELLSSPNNKASGITFFNKSKI